VWKYTDISEVRISSIIIALISFKGLEHARHFNSLLKNDSENPSEHRGRLRLCHASSMSRPYFDHNVP
jgi:hypothetical protein